MNKIINFFNYKIKFTDNISLSIKGLIFVLLVILISSVLLNIIRRIITRKLPKNDEIKFITLFSYGKWIIYLLVFLTTLGSIGVDVTSVLAASAALLIGVGMALQTMFQDVMAGVLILIDKTLSVGDIIELHNGKVGRVEEIRLRTTRAVTIDNRILIIPNHLFLTNSLYNWTQNGKTTREIITIGVAYGSDVNLVKELLLKAANNNDSVLVHPAPTVFFDDFGESALVFKLVFSLNNSFKAVEPKSDVRFEIDRLFREHNIKIPFPQRDIHIKEKV